LTVLALTDVPARGQYRVAERIQMHGSSRSSRADVADLCWKAVHSDEWAHRSRHHRL